MGVDVCGSVLICMGMTLCDAYVYVARLD